MAQHKPCIYISDRAGADPVKTIILLAPEADAATAEGVRAFARRSGWVWQAENDAAVLVAPVAPDGWDAESADLPLELYQEYRRSFRAPGADGIAGRGGNLWAWETLIYVVGYAEGARLAGDFVAAHPNVAAAVALVDGRASSLAALDEPSDHWLVPEPAGYALRNRDVPVALWLMGADTDGGAMRRAFCTVDGATRYGAASLGGRDVEIYDNPQAPAQRVLVSPGLTGEDPAIARLVQHDFFNHVIRWKNGPDGQLALRRSKHQFFNDGTFEHSFVEEGGNRYHYAVYLPAGMSHSEAAGLPLVLSVHGRGEPTWIFSCKNGWEDLADETQAFAVLLPDSPGNIWNGDRDIAALGAIVRQAVEEYGFDASRVYLSGFSNGALFTGQAATALPQLFAAASPWNSPGYRALEQDGLGSFAYAPAFAESGFELPFWAVYGDSDDKAPAVREDGFDQVLAANGCAPEPAEVWSAANRYTAAAGYAQGGRLRSEVYCNEAGVPMAGYTMMKNMPHGAIADEARAAWEFMNRFRRVDGAKNVEVLA